MGSICGTGEAGGAGCGRDQVPYASAPRGDAWRRRTGRRGVPHGPRKGARLRGGSAAPTAGQGRVWGCQALGSIYTETQDGRYPCAGDARGRRGRESPEGTGGAPGGDRRNRGRPARAQKARASISDDRTSDAPGSAAGGRRPVPENRPGAPRSHQGGARRQGAPPGPVMHNRGKRDHGGAAGVAPGRPREPTRTGPSAGGALRHLAGHGQRAPAPTASQMQARRGPGRRDRSGAEKCKGAFGQRRGPATARRAQALSLQTNSATRRWPGPRRVRAGALDRQLTVLRRRLPAPERPSRTGSLFRGCARRAPAGTLPRGQGVDARSKPLAGVRGRGRRSGPPPTAGTLIRRTITMRGDHYSAGARKKGPMRPLLSPPSETSPGACRDRRNPSWRLSSPLPHLGSRPRGPRARAR